VQSKSFLAVILLVISANIARAQVPQDLQNKIDLASNILSELRTGQFDVLESQYQDFKDQRQIQPDGTPRSWIYWWAFSQGTLGASSLEDAEAITAKIREWRQVKLDSVPALLALCDAILGECEKIENQSIAKNLNPSAAPEIVQQLQTRVNEIAAAMKAVPYKDQPTLFAEPEYFAVTVHVYNLASVGYDRFQDVDEQLQAADPYYVPFYSQALVWLTNHRKHDMSLPRPEVWLNNRVKPSLMESDDVIKRKTETYAQVISFTSPDKVHLDVNLIDWPTLKTGLKNLVQDYRNSGWPSRYLLTAFQEKDREAAKEAFGIVGGNFSPEVIQPDKYRQIAQWIEQG
jgi:hypothetical protein